MGENNPTYTPSPAEEGFAIMVRVIFTDDRGQTETLTSAATTAVIAADCNTEATGLPLINGTPQVGEKLTADTSAIRAMTRPCLRGPASRLSRRGASQ